MVLRGDALPQIIGKQVKVLYDLVTVKSELAANMSLRISGRLLPALRVKSGDLPSASTGIVFRITRY